MDLPIEKYKGQILSALEKHQVVVICAETGAGKSTQVPQYLLHAGYRTVVTQPRRLAARALAERIAAEVGSELGGVVGYRTGYERVDSCDTRLLLCTDGLELVRELAGQLMPDILVIDEVHEGSLQLEMLIAWTKKRMDEGCPMKIVLMSATMDAQRLAAFYGPDTPIITVPGRTFPVTVRFAQPANMISTIVELAEKGKNILVFQPGKKEIEETIALLQKAGCRAVLLPLHGDLEPEEQRRCFDSYDMPKVIVSTNVAQTSVTVSGIDIVCDSAEERRFESRNGVDGLYLHPISQADCLQRKGRAGRVKKGVYVFCSTIPFKMREAFPTPDIQRCRLGGMVLRLAAAGVDARDLRFFHQPAQEAIDAAEKSLYALGALDAEGKLTADGRIMARLPLEPQHARMVAEARKLKVSDDVITIAALMSVGGIRNRTNDWRKLTTEKNSDFLAEFDLWTAGRFRRREDLESMGIDPYAYAEAAALRQKIVRALRGQFKVWSTGNRQDILKACVAGMVEHLHKLSGDKYVDSAETEPRKTHSSSVLNYKPQWIVGKPLNVEVRYGGQIKTKNILTMVSAVDPFWLVSAAPQLVRHDYSSGSPALTFGGHTIS